jgi:hypothetical protein
MQQRQTENNVERCATQRCHGEPALTYIGTPLCQRCWERVCEQDNEAVPADGAADQDHADALTASAKEEENEMATKNKSKARKTNGNGKANAKAKAPAKPAAKHEAKPKRVSAIDAAAQVLKAAGKPMRSQELIEAMAKQGLWKSPEGKTPHATLYSAMLREITTKGKKARFNKVDRGQFAFNKEGA